VLALLLDDPLPVLLAAEEPLPVPVPVPVPVPMLELLLAALLVVLLEPVFEPAEEAPLLPVLEERPPVLAAVLPAPLVPVSDPVPVPVDGVSVEPGPPDPLQLQTQAPASTTSMPAWDRARPMCLFMGFSVSLSWVPTVACVSDLPRRKSPCQLILMSRGDPLPRAPSRRCRRVPAPLRLCCTRHNGRVIRPGAPFAPVCVWQVLQLPLV
jgi:hypothetical protein